MPVEVVNRVAESVEVTTSTVELMQTLKIMGYKTALVSRGFGCVSDILGEKLGIDTCIGVPLLENDDTMAMTGELDDGALERLDREAVIDRLVEREGVAREDITVISDDDASGEPPPGLRLQFDMKVLLEYYNQRILSREVKDLLFCHNHLLIGQVIRVRVLRHICALKELILARFKIFNPENLNLSCYHCLEQRLRIPIRLSGSDKHRPNISFNLLPLNALKFDA